MNKTYAIGTSVLVATAFMVAQGAWAADSKSFITQAIQGNLAEISMGKLAQDKGGSDAVKQYGAMLVTDHTAANDKATQAAKTLGVTAPTEPTSEQKQMHDTLAKASGQTFDRDFAREMVQDHQKDVADYKAEADASTKDAASQYAADTLPRLQKHLSDAQTLAKDTGNETAATTGAATTDAAASGDNKTPPLAGANSFTEGQAKSRIEAAGFSGVSALKKDDQGIWRGTATKGGASTPVALDFKGNVVAK
jgi:putative membrane protein